MAELAAAAWIAAGHNGQDTAHLLFTPIAAGHRAALHTLATGWGLAPADSGAPPFATVTAYVGRLLVTVEGVRLPVRRHWASLARTSGLVLLAVGDIPRESTTDAAAYASETAHLHVGLASVAATG